MTDTGWKKVETDFKCLRCGQAGELEFKVIDDIHDDIKYRCNACGGSWISEGPDY